MARPLYHPPIEEVTIDGILYALSDPVRRTLLFAIMGCDGMNGKQAGADLPPSTLSFHLKILRETGLIRSEKRGVEVFNTGRKAEIEEHFPQLLHSIFQHHKATAKK